MRWERKRESVTDGRTGRVGGTVMTEREEGRKSKGANQPASHLLFKTNTAAVLYL